MHSLPISAMRISKTVTIAAACVTIPVLVSSVFVTTPNAFQKPSITCEDNNAQLQCIWNGPDAGFADCRLLNGAVAAFSSDTFNMRVECSDGSWGTLSFNPAAGGFTTQTAKDNNPASIVTMTSTPSIKSGYSHLGSIRRYYVQWANENQLLFSVDFEKRMITVCDSKIPTETMASSKVEGGPSYEFNNKIVKFVFKNGHRGKYEFTERGGFVEELISPDGLAKRTEIS